VVKENSLFIQVKAAGEEKNFGVKLLLD